MAYQVKELAANVDDLSLIPRTTWWKERTDSYTLFSELHMLVNRHRNRYTCTHTYMQATYNIHIAKLHKTAIYPANLLRCQCIYNIKTYARRPIIACPLRNQGRY